MKNEAYGILEKPELDDLYDSQIEHGWLKDAVAKTHKYIKRWKGKNGKWQYQYEKTKKEISKKANKIKEYIVKEGKKTGVYKKVKRKIADRNYRKYNDPSLYYVDSRFNRSESKDVREQKGKLYKNQSGKRFKYVGRVKTPYGYRYFYDQKEYDKYMARYKNLIEQEGGDYIHDLHLKTLTKPETVSESVKNVNPNYGDGSNLPYSINCQRCCLTFEMRQRGFDVEAGANPEGFSEFDTRFDRDHAFDRSGHIYNYFEHNDSNYSDWKVIPYGEREAISVSNRYDNPEKVWFEKQMDAMPNDSRGIITVEWEGYNCGHALNWVKDSKGTVSIVDSQIGKTYTPDDFYKKPAVYTNIMRTDNLSIAFDFKYQYAMDNSEDDIFLNRGHKA